jgi:hypothetical protein
MRAPDGSAMVPKIESACRHKGLASQSKSSRIFDNRERGFRFIASIESVGFRE